MPSFFHFPFPLAGRGQLKMGTLSHRASGLLLWVILAFPCKFLQVSAVDYDESLAEYLIDFAGKQNGFAAECLLLRQDS